MKKFSVLLVVAMMLLTALSGCTSGTGTGGKTVDAQLGPIYDDYSDMTDEQLYELAQKEGGQINIYATSSKMLKEEEPFETLYPGLDVVVTDLDQDEVLQKAVTEHKTGNITGDVLQAKDVNGDVFYNYYEEGIVETFYPKDLCAYIDEDLLKYGYPLYAGEAFWFYNTEAFPDGSPLTNWWQLLETNADGTQKFIIYTKEIGQETSYLSLFASFIVNSDQMAAAYKEEYGKDLEYTYDASAFDFEAPKNNAGVEFLWRFTQLKMTFIGDGDELVLAVNNGKSTEHPTVALCSAGKLENRDKSGYAIAWCTNLKPYTGLKYCEYLYVVKGCDNPAGARLFIRYITGSGDDGSGLKPFTKVGNWPVRSDVKDKKNEITLDEAGAIDADLKSIYDQFIDTQDMWNYWLDKNPNMK